MSLALSCIKKHLVECLDQNCISEECTEDIVQLQALLPNIVSSIYLLLEGEGVWNIKGCFSASY